MTNWITNMRIPPTTTLGGFVVVFIEKVLYEITVSHCVNLILTKDNFLILNQHRLEFDRLQNNFSIKYDCRDM